LEPTTCGILAAMRLRSLLAVAQCALALGCASAGTHAPAPAGPPPEDAAAYFPLTAGWKWAYELQRGGDNLLATYAVLNQIGDTVIVETGEERIGYVVSPAGIARRDGLAVKDFLLKTPIRAGATWALEAGQAKVTEVGKTVTVPAGTYPNCATVEEVRHEPERVVRTVYAAGIGPISVEFQTYDPARQRFTMTVRAALRGVTRPGEDPLGGGAPPNPPPR
jgi:hypothetical protein